MFETYCRLNVHVMASDLTVIRAIRRKLRKEILHVRAARTRRHSIYRDTLIEHHDARTLYLHINRGI